MNKNEEAYRIRINHLKILKEIEKEYPFPHYQNENIIDPDDLSRWLKYQNLIELEQAIIDQEEKEFHDE